MPEGGSTGMPDTLRLYYRMDPRRIVLIKSLLDGHEGVLVQRTHDPAQGIVELLVGPDFEADVQDLLASLSASLWLEPVPAPQTARSFRCNGRDNKG